MAPANPEAAGFGDYLRSLRSIQGLVASLGILIPAAATFLSTLTPPPHLATAPIVAALAVATLVGTYYYTPGGRKKRKKGLPLLVRRGLIAILLSVVLFALYLPLLNHLTVQSSKGKRYQIGFYTADFGLTAEGREVKAKDGDKTPYEWMMNDALFSDSGPRKLWEWWAITLSFLICFFVFAATFVIWTHGWALLAKQRALSGDIPDAPAPASDQPDLVSAR